MAEKKTWICIPNREKEMAPFFFLCLSRFKVERRSSFPYITGDTWRFFCDWHLTENETFDPSHVGKGDTVFVAYQCLEQFQTMARKIKQPFILITPNVENYSDNPLPGKFCKLLSIKMLRFWFLQNIDCPVKERLVPIPIGLPNGFQGEMEVKNRTRDLFVYVNFNVDTQPKQRKPCLAFFSKKNWAHCAEPKPHSDYVEDLARSRFVVSPPGSGLDCHRTWEALYLGCYPIVLSTTLNPLYEDLPVVVVGHWEEVTPELLEKKEREFQKGNWNFSKLYMPYWLEKVSSLQQKLRS